VLYTIKTQEQTVVGFTFTLHIMPADHRIISG